MTEGGPRESGPVLRLRGTVAVRDGLGRVQPLPGGRGTELLVLLAVEGDWVSRDRLGALFWPDHAPSGARRNLRKVLHRLQVPAGLPPLQARESAVRWAVATDLHLRLRLEALVLPGVAYELSAQLLTSIGAASPDITRADFLHTAQLSVFLPPDLTMVGANGFLSELPGVGGGAVPEPGGLAFAGLAALVAARRVRRPRG